MGSKGSQTTTQNTTTAPDPNAYAAYQQLLQRASGVASTPYQAYGGELVAGINPQQNNAISGINQFATSAQPSVQAGLGQIASAGAPLTAATIQQYMNPYTQNVVNATQAQFANTNAQQQQQLTGNAIAQGALGGNRTAVAGAELANQQNLAQAPVIAGLYNQGYGQAVNTAQTEQQLGLQAGSLTGNLGIAGQTAGLQGAGAQLGAGTLQQNTQQMLDTAQLQQFAQAAAFPYQQTQWLAGLDTGVGSQMGGTSNGTTTGPAPNQLSSILGGVGAGVGALGATGAFGSTGWLASALPMLAMSDERVKENIRSIGKTHDGQTIYRFNYKGNPQTHIGFLAQEVERKHPEAVHNINGLKAVDYKAATDDSIKRASGGAVPGFAVGGVPGMPYAGLGNTYIPTNTIVHGSGPPRAQAPQLQNPQSQTQQDAKSIGDIAKTIMGNSGGSTPSLNADGSIAGAVGPTSIGGAPLVTPGIADANSMLSGIYKRGGVVGYGAGGDPTFDDSGFPTDDAHNQGIAALRAAMPGAGYGSDADRARGLDDLREGMQKQYGVNPNDPIRLDPTADQAWRDTTPMGVGEPNPGQPIMDDQSTPTGNRSVAQGATPSSGLAFAGNSDNSDLPPEVALGYSKRGNQQGVASPSTSPSSGGINWGADSKLWPALMAAGFGMMSSRSPFLGVAIGEGGMAGMGQYGAEQTREFEANKLAQQQALEREKMNLPYQNMTADQKAIMAWHQQDAMRQAMQPVKIGTDSLNRDVMAVRDLKTGRYLDPVTMQPINPAVLQRPTVPLPAQFNIPGQEGPVSGGTPTKPTPTDTGANIAAGATPALKAGNDPSDVIPMEAKPTANDGKNYEILQQYPELANKLKAVDEGRMSIAHAVGMKNKDAFTTLLTQYDPDFTDMLWNSRNKQWMDLSTNGNAGKMILATNQLLPHLNTLSEKAEALDNSEYPGYNIARNWWSQNVHQNPKIKDFETVRTVAATDTAKLLRGAGSMSLEEVKTWENAIASADSPRTLQQVIHTLADDLIDARIDSIKQSFRMNTKQEPPDFVSDKAKAALGSIKQRWAKVQGSEPGSNAPTRTAPQQPQAPARKTQNGYVYEQQSDGSWKPIGKQ